MVTTASTHVSTFDISKFWTLEEIPDSSNVLPADKLSDEFKIVCKNQEELFAENHFCKTVTRDETGRVCVSLPFMGDVETLGSSERIARVRFINNEKKLLSIKFVSF